MPRTCRMLAPMAMKPRMSTFTGRTPMAQPPGCGDLASPARLSRGPTVRKEALMRCIRASGGATLSIWDAWIVMDPLPV